MLLLCKILTGIVLVLAALGSSVISTMWVTALAFCVIGAILYVVGVETGLFLRREEGDE